MDASRVAEALKSGANRLREVARETSTGRIDLRGIPLGGGQLRIADQRIAEVDLSAADVSGAMFHRTEFINCLFDGADFRGVTQWGMTYRSCSFVETDCSDASFGADGAELSDCSFVRAKFTRTSIVKPRFIGCTFDECRLKGVDFYMSSLEKCRFRGLLADVRFNGYIDDPLHRQMFGSAPPNPMKNVDFSEARFEYVSFANHCPLATVLPPRDSGHVLILDFPGCINEVERQTVRSTSPEIRRGADIWIPLLRTFAQDQESYILSQSDFRKEGAEFAETFVGWFKECASAEQQP